MVVSDMGEVKSALVLSFWLPGNSESIEPFYHVPNVYEVYVTGGRPPILSGGSLSLYHLWRLSLLYYLIDSLRIPLFHWQSSQLKAAHDTKIENNQSKIFF